MTTMTADPRSVVRDQISHIKAVRHELHRHPELGYEETRTSEIVRRELEALGVEFKAGLAGGTGVLGWIPATSNPDGAKTVALRADMDALPISEATAKPYASENPGVMHACGHDGHTSILIGTARTLSAMPERPNNVLLVFQPAEEGGAGGERMCADGCLDGSILGKPADVIYGLHGWTDIPLGCVSTRNGPILAATDEFSVTIRGAGGHAAYPHYCTDPVVIAAHIVTALQTIASRRADPLDSVVCTVGAIHAGDANNVIPDSCEIRGTIRTLRSPTRAMAEAEFRRIVKGVADSLGAKAEIDWHVGYPVTENHTEPTERFRAVARRALGDDKVLEFENPGMGGEDFSFYGQHVPACFYLLGLLPHGQKQMAKLHTPEFDFNDEALPIGIEMMARLATEPV